jgi:uncharacterized protein YjeT (DUF2065 family)
MGEKGVCYQMQYFITVMGMVMILEGMPYFVFPGKIKTWLQMLIETSDQALRGLGLGLMLIGLLLVYIGRRA